MTAENREPDDITALEVQLAQLEERLQAGYCRMGKNLLALADCEQRAIDGLVDQIIELKQQISRAKSERQCPACMAFSPSGSLYCRHCGQRLPHIEEDTDHE